MLLPQIANGATIESLLEESKPQQKGKEDKKGNATQAILDPLKCSTKTLKKQRNALKKRSSREASTTSPMAKPPP
ncbi:hypothetical protein FGO68_gene858 [Halteria grandinella]|uniref:Uncharacterized protein n=1 Tax=Halteria grandinella TaxID=5974 RepID=A0A8J8SZ94_HALGN|nr:hypothetical protein FGO68_gene858 [Halteria grandinella]